MPEAPINTRPKPQPRRPTLVAAGLLLAALALVVLYTSRRAFMSPMALVVVAAIGVAALLLQIRMRPDVSPSVRAASTKGSLWLNALGVVFAACAVGADVLHPEGLLMLIAALAAVISFSVSGLIVLGTLRKR